MMMMNKEELLNKIMTDYGKYIKTWIYRFHKKYEYCLDVIYDIDDLEQMIYINIWQYLDRYNESKGTLKSYITNNMKWMLRRALYLSFMSKRNTTKKTSLDREYTNKCGEKTNLYDVIPDESFKNMDNNLYHFFNKAILRETYKRVYELRLKGYTLREIGKIFNVSHQRIEQIVRKFEDEIRRMDEDNKVHCKNRFKKIAL